MTILCNFALCYEDIWKMCKIISHFLTKTENMLKISLTSIHILASIKNNPKRLVWVDCSKYCGWLTHSSNKWTCKRGLSLPDDLIRSTNEFHSCIFHKSKRNISWRVKVLCKGWWFSFKQNYKIIQWWKYFVFNKYQTKSK